MSTQPAARSHLALRPTAPVLLDSAAARSCPVKTQNAHLPWLSQPDRPLEPAALARRVAQSDRRRRLLDDWVARTAGAVDLRPLISGPVPDRVAAAVRALALGAPLVVAATLPTDWAGHRVGTPDALVRGPDRIDGRPGYHPVEILSHRVLTADPPVGTAPDAPRSLSYGTLDRPLPGVELPGFRLRTGSRVADFLQLAHYVRMLAAAGLDASGRRWGGVIGTDPAPDPTGLPATEPIIGWQDLAGEPASFLDKYDAEHGFRLAIAASARQQTGDPAADPPLLVRPIVNGECASCRWWQVCRPQLDDDDLSLRIERGRLRPREVIALRDLGVTTATDLARADVEPLVTAYLARVGERLGAEGRLRTAARRARMLVAGDEFARETSTPIELPAADIEIDFDLETAADGRIYLWGFWVADGLTPPYCRQFWRFDDLDADAEITLAREAVGWLRDRVSGPGLARVYHYSSFEVAKLRELADRSGDPLLVWAAEYAERQFVDLLEVTKAHYFGVSGLGLKAIARHAGFRWRDPDPGGLNSQCWFAEAVHGPPDRQPLARRRVLEYNEDDVIATSRLRGWLRAQ